MLEVTVYPLGAKGDTDGILFENIDYVSFINADTYGRPAIIAPGPDHKPGELTVLYINTGGIAAAEVHKAS